METLLNRLNPSYFQPSHHSTDRSNCSHMVDIRPNPLQPNLTDEGKGKWHCPLPFITPQNSVEVSPHPPSHSAKKVQFIVLTLRAVRMFSAVVECNGNKESCDPLSSSSLPAIHPPPSFNFNFSLFIAGELSL